MGKIAFQINSCKWIACIMISLVMRGNVYAQCFNQVTDTSGISLISGISVAITSFGAASTNTVYCTSTTPYNIGYLVSSGNTSNSGYTFQFTPAVDSITLNFSGISNTPPFQEIVMVEINGVRYAISSAGSSNGCDPLAELTPSGYITGCTGCGVSGWNGTTIAGPISMVTVIDSAALNGPGGNQSLFSLFFCSADNTGIANNNITNAGINVYPNPVNNELSFTVNNNESCLIILYDIFSRKLLSQKFTSSHTVNVSNLAKGIYIYEVRNNNGVIKKGKVVKE